MSGRVQGRCLCGALRINAALDRGDVSVCHCNMCRVWAGGMQAFLVSAQAEVTGDVRLFRASDFAERAFCGVCGSALWLRDDRGDYEFSPGLFDLPLRLSHEVYADRAQGWCGLAGEHPRITAAGYEAAHKHVGASG